MGGDKSNTEFWWENFLENCHLEDHEREGMITSRWIREVGSGLSILALLIFRFCC
jgi:hypothetical protein